MPAHIINAFLQALFYIIFPEPQDKPSSLCQLLVCSPVPFDIAPQFFLPELPVGSYLFARIVLMSPCMPEISVNKDSDAVSGKDNVRLPWQSPYVFAVTKSAVP